MLRCLRKPYSVNKNTLLFFRRNTGPFIADADFNPDNKKKKEAVDKEAIDKEKKEGLFTTARQKKKDTIHWHLSYQ